MKPNLERFLNNIDAINWTAFNLGVSHGLYGHADCPYKHKSEDEHTYLIGFHSGVDQFCSEYYPEYYPKVSRLNDALKRASPVIKTDV
jgi:hypothetical protein